MAKIKLDVDRRVDEIDENIFGSFVEHLGRCVYGGIYDKESPRSDEDGFRGDVIESVRDLGISQIRWPGGNFVSGYHWQDGIGSEGERPTRMELAWGATESNKFGTDEFMKFCDKAGVDPYLCVNMGTGTLDEAQRWVEYCNGEGDTHYAKMRTKLGEEKPYRVKYWGLGNEVYGEWQIGHMSAEDYAKEAKEYAKVMKRTDPSIELIAVGAGSDWPNCLSWNRTVVEELAGKADYIAPHMYVGNEDDDYYRYMGTSEKIKSTLDMIEGIIDSKMFDEPEEERMKIAFDEWNVWYRTTSEDRLEEKYNLEDALVAGMFLNAFIRHCDSVKIANQAQLVNVIPLMTTEKDDLVKETIYYPFSVISNHNSGYGLDVHLDCETYEYEESKETSYLDVSASYNPEEKTLALNVINKRKEDPVSVEIDNQTGDLKSPAHAFEVNGDNPKVQNTFEEKYNVRTIRKTIDQVSNNFVYDFPPHSLTTLKFEIQF